MRVISGKCRGTKLIAPEGMNTRPTTDRMKETLFNMIAFDVPECRFLDLFSGSGAIGIESLSRGAKKAVLVEQHPEALKCIEANLQKTSLKEAATVYGMEVMKSIQLLGQKEEQFDIIFLDPPYALETIQAVLTEIVAKNLLSPDGYIILEHGTGSDFIVDGLGIKKEKKLKTTTITFYERTSAQ